MTNFAHLKPELLDTKYIRIYYVTIELYHSKKLVINICEFKCCHAISWLLVKCVKGKDKVIPVL
jgi:hypothetical protein